MFCFSVMSLGKTMRSMLAVLGDESDVSEPFSIFDDVVIGRTGVVS